MPSRLVVHIGVGSFGSHPDLTTHLKGPKILQLVILYYHMRRYYKRKNTDSTGAGLILAYISKWSKTNLSFQNIEDKDEEEEVVLQP